MGTDQTDNIIGRSGEHYVEKIARSFTAEDSARTTILMAGLTISQDRFISAAFRGYGYRMLAMDVPDNAALRVGKEFGNRGQCNPTYFTVGNLVKFLQCLRDEKGLSTEAIIKDYVFVTAGACGPCRFGTYITEYRKALRDAGFEGFRVLSVSQTAGADQSIGEGGGIEATAGLFKNAMLALLLGDVLNAMMYRIRPYEVNSGETDEVITECRADIESVLENKQSLLAVAWRCRKRLLAIPVNKSQKKPKVAIVGEFWAMTTEGDGNYHLQRFLESEGAEVDIQLMTGWFLYLIWQAQFDTRNRMRLRGADDSRRGLSGVNARKRLMLLWFARGVTRTGFQFFAKLMGLSNYKLTDMDELAKISEDFYDTENRGGEGHMEVGKLIMNAMQRKVHMTISVKPFGCMPSAGVSDGVQSKITELYPEAIFLPIETTGDGAVNVYSRIQMQLHKARKLVAA